MGRRRQARAPTCQAAERTLWHSVFQGPIPRADTAMVALNRLLLSLFGTTLSVPPGVVVFSGEAERHVGGESSTDNQSKSWRLEPRHRLWLHRQLRIGFHTHGHCFTFAAN